MQPIAERNVGHRRCYEEGSIHVREDVVPQQGHRRTSRIEESLGSRHVKGFGVMYDLRTQTAQKHNILIHKVRILKHNTNMLVRLPTSGLVGPWLVDCEQMMLAMSWTCSNGMSAHQGLRSRVGKRAGSCCHLRRCAPSQHSMVLASSLCCREQCRQRCRSVWNQACPWR